MKLFDCFMFFNELDILELRLMEVYDYVDYIVIVEGNKTHTGKDKEFIFEQNKDRYAKWLDKIIYVQVTDFPEYDPRRPAKLENHQRYQIMVGVNQKAKLGDEIMVSDIDEIPNMEMIMPYVGKEGWWHFKCDLFYNYVNVKCDCGFGGVVMAPLGQFKNTQRLRMMAIRKLRFNPQGYNVIDHAGWHYSYLTGGDPNKLKNKAENIFESYALVPLLGTDEEISDKIKNHKDMWNRRSSRYKQSVVDIANNKPKHLDEWLKVHPQYFYAQN